MGSHIVEGEFQSDKYPTTPRGKVPLSVRDPTAQDLLWEYARRRRAVDAEFSDDLEAALRAAGYVPGEGSDPEERVPTSTLDVPVVEDSEDVDSAEAEDRPRSYTLDEMRRALLGHLRQMVHYWATCDFGRLEFKTAVEASVEVRHRLDGLVHGVLVMLDGCSGDMPAFNLAPAPHPDDEAFRRHEGENWWPSGVVLNECQLHELWYRDRPMEDLQAPVDPPGRDARQAAVADWARRAFGEARAASVPHRALRLLEEACEVYQAAGAGQPQAHQLLDFVFSRPPGIVDQELGGVGVCLLALAQAVGVSADAVEAREVERVLHRPIDGFQRRDQDKVDAGFSAVDVDAGGQGGGPR